MLSLDSADTGISETGEKTRRVRYVRFAVYFHVRAQERGREDSREKEGTERAAREIEKDEKDSTYVRRRSSLTKLCSTLLREYPAETED